MSKHTMALPDRCSARETSASALAMYLASPVSATLAVALAFVWGGVSIMAVVHMFTADLRLGAALFAVFSFLVISCLGPTGYSFALRAFPRPWIRWYAVSVVMALFVTILALIGSRYLP